MARTLYLIYRPVMDYEESMAPYVICESNEQAKRIVRECLDFLEKLVNSLPEIPEDEDDPDGEKFREVMQKRREMTESAKWPHGICLSQDVPYVSRSIDRGCLAVMGLPLLRRKSETAAKEDKQP